MKNGEAKSDRCAVGARDRGGYSRFPGAQAAQASPRCLVYRFHQTNHIQCIGHSGARPSRESGIHNPAVDGFRAHRQSASKTRVNALTAAPRNDGRNFVKALAAIRPTQRRL
jgi:hypothetical protein